MSYVELDHGTGGLLSRQLVENVIAPAFGDRYLGAMEDSAVLSLPGTQIAMTTDSFVVDPLFFEGGDIGKLAVCGTVNDIAVSGAKPLYLTVGLILEEGLPVADLVRAMTSMAEAAREAGVYIVAGDTKVVHRGAADKIFINTAGVGWLAPDALSLTNRRIRAGDSVVITSSIGAHSIHLLSLREGLGYENRVTSDCAPLNHLISDIHDQFGERLHAARDLTRGGLGTALTELADDIGLGIDVDLDSVPIQSEVIMAADMLGVDPIYLANEGSCLLFCDPDVSKAVVTKLRELTYGGQAAEIGVVVDRRDKSVFARSVNGDRLIEPLVGAQLPRLC